MKAILMSIRPQWVARILNKEKTIEVRKRFPSDYVGWVYIYCTKGKTTFEKTLARYHDAKVVARFWCDKVEEIECIASDNGFAIERYITKELSVVDIMEKSCLYFEDLKDYLYYSNGYAIHITNLEIFDKPKEISEFSSKTEKTCICFNQFVAEGTQKIPLTRAPQSFCFIEV